MSLPVTTLPGIAAAAPARAVGVPAAAAAAVPGDAQVPLAQPFTAVLRELVGAFAGVTPLPTGEAVPAEIRSLADADADPAADRAPEVPVHTELVATGLPLVSIDAPAPVASGPLAALRHAGGAVAVAVAPARLPQTVPAAVVGGTGSAPQGSAADAMPQQAAFVPGSSATFAPTAATHGADSLRAPIVPATADQTAVASSAAMSAAPASPANADTVVAETVLKLPNGAASQWRQPLQQALGERLRVDVERGIERAVIRLDPPAMGSVEIVIRHQGGALQVQVSATHAEVVRQLQGIVENLREGLVQRHFGDVSVQVSDAAQDGAGRQRRGQAQDEDGAPGRALGDASRTAFALDADRE